MPWDLLQNNPLLLCHSLLDSSCPGIFSRTLVSFLSFLSVLLCFVIPRVRKIKSEASSCLGIFFRTLRFYYVTNSLSLPLPHLLDGHGKLVGCSVALRVEFSLKTDGGYPKDTGVNKPWQPLEIPSAITPFGQLHQSPPSPIPGDLGRGPSHQSTCSNIETRMDRPKSDSESVVRVISGVA